MPQKDLSHCLHFDFISIKISMQRKHIFQKSTFLMILLLWSPEWQGNLSKKFQHPTLSILLPESPLKFQDKRYSGICAWIQANIRKGMVDLDFIIRCIQYVLLHCFLWGMIHGCFMHMTLLLVRFVGDAKKHVLGCVRKKTKVVPVAGDICLNSNSERETHDIPEQHLNKCWQNNPQPAQVSYKYIISLPCSKNKIEMNFQKQARLSATCWQQDWPSTHVGASGWNPCGVQCSTELPLMM